jgi:hypothetical protein
MSFTNAGPSTTSTNNTVAVVAPVSTQTNSVTPQGANAFRLLAVQKGVNVNATGDSAIMSVINASSYSVFQVVMANASISLTTAAAGVFTAAAAGGTAVVANAALSGLTGATVVSQRTVASTAVLTAQQLYVNLGTAQGAAATVDVYVYGFDLS